MGGTSDGCANEGGGGILLKNVSSLATIFSSTHRSKEQVYIDDVEDMLDDFMLSLNPEIGDGSVKEVAEKLMIMHEECSDGKFESIKRLKETNSPTVSYAKLPDAICQMEVDNTQCQSLIKRQSRVKVYLLFKEHPKLKTMDGL